MVENKEASEKSLAERVNDFEKRGADGFTKDVVPQEGSFLATIERLASRPDVDPEKIKQFMDMQERVLDRNAQQAFNAAMTEAQNKIDLVVADSWNEQTKSKYANLKTILVQIKPVYTTAGFSLMFYEGVTDKPDHKRVCVDIMHRQGHTENRWGDFAIQTKGIAGKTMMTQIHGEGSAFQYGRRYLTCMIFNVPTGDDDNGQAAGAGEHISEGQIKTIKDLIKTVKANEPKFLEFMGKALKREIKSIDKIPSTGYDRAIAELERKTATKKTK